MIKAINGNVVLRVLEEEETTYGNIVIPDMGKERPELGEVVDLSPTYNWHKGEYVSSNAISKGDIVVIPRMGAVKVSHESQEYIIIKETEILAIIKK